MMGAHAQVSLTAKSYYRWIILIACILVYCTSQLGSWNYAGVSKYLIDDLGIGKPEIGLLGSAFFYAYAIAQIPWGAATDVLGGRRVIPLGVAALALFLTGFAFITTFRQAVLWRTLMGFVAAGGFVPVSSVLAKWFGKKELGFAMAMFSGVGGGLGQAVTFLVVPLMALLIPSGGIFSLRLSGWRGSTFVMGIVVLAIAIASALLLRSNPVRSNPAAISPNPVKTAEHKKENANYKDAALGIGKDPALWIISLVWSGYIVAARLAPGWLPLYATEFYMSRGISKPQAIVAGGAMATFYVLGRTIGTPMVGKLSDVLLKRYGVPRAAVIFVGLLGIAALFYAFTMAIAAVYLLGVLYFLSGVLINIFPLINASAAEIWSSRTEGFSLGMINTVGQFAGAGALSASGFLAVKYSVAGGAFHTEFLGIWYLGIITSLSAAVAALYMVRREKKAAEKPDTKVSDAVEINNPTRPRKRA